MTKERTNKNGNVYSIVAPSSKDDRPAVAQNLFGMHGPLSLIDSGYQSDGWLMSKYYAPWANQATWLQPGEVHSPQGSFDGHTCFGQPNARVSGVDGKICCRIFGARHPAKMTGDERSLGGKPSQAKRNEEDVRGRGIAWRQIGILYRRELRAAFREKSIVFHSIFIPLFLYPFMLWIAFTAILFVQGQTEGARSRVAVFHWPHMHPDLERRFEQDQEVQLLEPKDVDTALQRITNGSLDALVEFLPAQQGESALAGNYRVRVTFNKSDERSITARQRAGALIENYRSDWLGREARGLGIGPNEWQMFTVSTRNAASKKEMGGFVLGLILPLLFVVTVAVGCFHPAVDTTAGERERNTWETLMATSASRVNIVVAKYLYVTTLGGLAGALNLLAMFLTIKPILAPLLAPSGEVMRFTVPMTAVPILAIAAILLAGFVAAGMMIFAAFAHTYKEGQAMITPFFLLVLLPVMFLQTPGLKFTLPAAFVPVANLTLMVRTAISGGLGWMQGAVTILVSLAFIALCLWLASAILSYEEVVVGSHDGGFLKFIQTSLRRRSQMNPTVGKAGDKSM